MSVASPQPSTTIALVINPIAGLGGTAGLKGSDGSQMQRAALARGATPQANSGAVRMLRRLAEVAGHRFTLITAGGQMGETAALKAGLTPQVASPPRPAAGSGLLSTTAEDTREAVRRFQEFDADLVLFVGGDGTARDVHTVSTDGPERQVFLGVPAGVKMQSAVFARSAEDAASIVIDWLANPSLKRRAEVADIDEEARRRGVLASHLHGYLNVPDTRRALQGGKVGSSVTTASLAGLAAGAYCKIDPQAMCVLGPGNTVQAVTTRLTGTGSLLGVDVAHRGHIIARDLSAIELNQITAGHRIQLVVSPVGGQGFLFGRGNQQLDASLLARVEREDLLILCTAEKLAQLRGGPLYIDVADIEHPERFIGYHRVISGLQQTASIRVENAQTFALDERRDK